VEFACGGRVAAALLASNRRNQEAAAALRCAPAELPAAAARVAEEAVVRRKELERLLAAAAVAEAERLSAAPPGPVRGVLAPPTQGAAAWIRSVAQGLAGRGRVALLGAVEGGRAYLAFARPRGDGPDLGEALRRAAAALGGKGGGAPDLAQGGGPEAARLEQVLEEAERGLG
jgi:alanyl-tRNA synthetase